RLVELVVDRVRRPYRRVGRPAAGPRRVRLRVDAEDVVAEADVHEAERVCCLCPGPHDAGVWSDLPRWELDADSHPARQLVLHTRDVVPPWRGARTRSGCRGGG